MLLVSSFLEHHWPQQHVQAPDLGNALTGCLEYMTSSFIVFASDSAALARRINKSEEAVGVTSNDKLSASMLHIVDPVPPSPSSQY